MSDDFLAKNKQVLLEELASSIQTLNIFVNELLETEETDKIVIGLAYHIGNLTGLFNQYTILETKEFPKEERQIGFRSLNEEKK